MEPLDAELEEGELELPTEPMMLNMGPSHAFTLPAAPASGPQPQRLSSRGSASSAGEG